MAIDKKTELVLDRKFDTQSCRHFVNGQVVVMHCHHYATLYCQLADDCSLLDAKALLAESAEDTFHEVLGEYYQKHDITSLDERLDIGVQYYAASGLGKMEVIFAGPQAGEVALIHSHVDEGWIKKWGKRDQPVNFITCGYIAALFAAIFDRPTRSFEVHERASIVAGAERSLFDVAIK